MVLYNYFVVPFWVIFFCANVELVAFQECTSSQPLKVSINSQKANTGKWISGVGVLSSDNEDQSRTSLDVEHRTVSCAGKNTYVNITLIFTYNSLELSGTLAPNTKAPPAGYELFPDVGYYKTHTIPTTWALARQKCAEEGAHLVIINSEKESDVIRTLMARHPTFTGADTSYYVWTGVEKKGDQYLTIDGDSLNTTGFLRWHPGEPERKVDFNCLLVHRETGGLADTKCARILSYICEYEL